MKVVKNTLCIIIGAVVGMIVTAFGIAVIKTIVEEKI